MTRRLLLQAAAILTLSFAAGQAVAQQTGVTVTYMGTQESLSQVQPRLYNVTPAVPVISFPASAVSGTPGPAQQITAVFNVNGNPGTFTPTAVLHYGASYSAGAVTCTGPVASMTCTVTITFQPLYPGGRRDALFFMNGTTRLATLLLYGIGNSPFAMVQPGVITQPIKGATAIFSSVVDENGTAYVLETQTNAIVSVTKAGVVTTLPITGLNSPRTIGVDGAGVLYIAGETAGGPITTYDTVQGTQGTFAVAVPSDIFPDIAVGNTGNIYAIDGSANVLYTTAPGGTVTHQAFSPAIPGPASMNVDSSENLFVGGQTTYELLAGATPQTQTLISANNSQNGLSLDAAGTLYVTPFTGGLGMTELPAPYTTPLTVLDPAATPIGGSEGPDGTVYVGTASSVDKVDRSQGSVVFTNSTTGTQNVAIYNGGNQSLTISNIALTGSPAFTLGTATTNNCTGGITLLPGALCNVVVSYSTTHAGVFNGTLTFTDNSLNSTNSTQTIAITGQFQGIYVTPSPASLNFNTQTVGTTSATQPIVLTNGGDLYNATINPATGTGPFNVALGTCTTPVVPAGTCTLQVSFSPTTTATYTNASIGMSAFSSGGGPVQSFNFTVSGTGIMPSAAVGSFAPASLAFGTQNINTTSPTQPLLLTNTGTAQLNLTTISITGANLSNFSETNTCGGGLAPNASCTINVSFSPNAVGPFSATVSVVDNAAASPTTATLTGTGVSLQVPQLQFTPAQLSAIAGTGTGKVIGTGDGGAALQATFNTPYGIAQDASGNIYVSDQDDNYVRKIDTGGNITAFAGISNSGPGSFSGDNGQATAANLSQPIGIAVDAAGNVYIADYGNARIRKVVPSTGIITTFAGDGNGFFNGGTAGTVPLPGPQGIAFDAAGNLYVACTNQQIIAKITPAGNQSLFAGVLTNPGPGVNSYNGDNQLAINADLNFPTDVAADQAGNIYIADSVNARIRKVAASTGIITTVAGTGTPGNTGDGAAATSAQINANSVATNLAGELYINAGSTIRKVDINGIITTIAGGGAGTVPGPATSVLLNGLGLVRTDNNGDLLIPSYQHFDGVLEAGPKGALVFPAQAIGTVSAPQTVLFENTGDTSLTLNQLTYTANGSFNVTGGTCISTSTLSVAGTCTLTVTFAPTVAGGVGAYTGSIPVASNSVGGATSILLQGTATAAVTAPVVTITPNPDAFLPSPVGVAENAPLPMSLTNTGNAPLIISSLTITGPDASSFSQTNNCPISPATLAVGSSCGITLLFTPSAAGPLTASISVAGNQAGSPTLGVLTGTGTVPQLVFSVNPLAFGNQALSKSSAPLPVTVSNPGGAPLLITSATLGGTNLSEFGEAATCPTTIAAGGSCTFQFVFTPQVAGPRSATLTIVDNAAGSPHVLNLTGTGVGTASFVSNVGTALAAQPVTVTITTAGTLNNVQVLTQGGSNLDFTVASGGSCTTTTAYTVGQTCTVNVVFNPLYPGQRDGAVVLSSSSGVLGTAFIPGTGTGPQINFMPDTQTVLGSGFDNPIATAVDAKGNIFVADFTNNAVKEIVAVNGVIPASPTINTLGSGFGEPSAVAVDGSGDVFVADLLNGAVKEIVAVNGVIPASPAINVWGRTLGFNGPSGVAVDGNGNVFVADSFAGVVKEMVAVNGVIPASPTINTLGSGFNGPTAVAVDGSGDVFVADSTNNAVKEMIAVNGVIPASPTINTLGSGFSVPQGVAVDAIGDVFVADTGNSTVKEMRAVNGSIPSSPTITTLGTVNDFALARGVSVDQRGNVYVPDYGDNRIVELDYADAPSLTFANTNIGATSADSPQVVTVENVGNAALAFSIPSAGKNPTISTNFSIGGGGTCQVLTSSSSSAYLLTQGSTCTLQLSFSPTASGPLSGSSVLTDNSLNVSNVTQTIALTGNGTATTAPIAALNPNPLNFPSTTVGTSSQTMTMSLGNSGSATLNITSISITGTNATSFSQTNNCGTSLPLDSSCQITITFKPTAAGALTANISVVDNATGSPHTAVINGTGAAVTAPLAVLSPNPLAFPSAAIGTPATLPMTLTNSGTAVLNINTITVTGTNASNFTFTNGCSASLGIGLSCTLNVTFTPTSAASFTAAISVSDNATGSPHTATLTGTGTGTTTSTFTVAATTSTASVQPGGVAQYNLTVAPLGGSYNNLVTLSASGLPAGATASFLPPAVTPGSAGAPSVLSIQTPSLLARERGPGPRSSVPLLAALAGVPLLGLAARRRLRKAGRRWILLAIVALAILPALALSGCGGGYYGPAARTFTITVTGTSGALQETTNVSLTVQ